MKKFEDWTAEVPSPGIVLRHKGRWSWRGPRRLDGKTSDTEVLRVVRNKVLSYYAGDFLPVDEWGGEWKKAT